MMELWEDIPRPIALVEEGRMTQLVPNQKVVFFKTMYTASPVATIVWWGLLLAGGLLPVGFALAMGGLITSVEKGNTLTGPLTFIGIVFVAMQVVNPVHVSIGQNLGRKTADHLNDRLMRATTAPPGHRPPRKPRSDQRALDGPGLRPRDHGATALRGDELHRRWARLLVAGFASALVLFGFRWWAPFVLTAGWASTHYLLRESGVWKDRNTDDGPRRPTPRRLRLPARGRRSGVQGTALVRTGRMGRRSFADADATL